MVGKPKYRVNANFFRSWNSKMAYILGFTFADGNIYKTTLTWKIHVRDKDLLDKINEHLESNYPVKVKGKYARLRINNKILVDSLKRLGVTPNKTRNCKFPKVPDNYLRHFIRGFLDGDGWIIADSKKNEICVGFCNGSYDFMKKLVEKLKRNVPLTTNNLRKSNRITKKGKISHVYEIEWYATNAMSILKYLYDNLEKEDLFLFRKFEKQIKARKIYIEVQKSSLQRKVEKRFGMPINILLERLLTKEKLNGVQIAKILGIDDATVYRWLEKTKLKMSVRKTRKDILTKCLNCGRRIKQPANYFVKYCSPQCRIVARRTGKIVKCVVCGKKIYRAKWWFKTNKIPFCSRTCIGEWQKMRLRMNLLLRSPKTGRFLSLSDFSE